VGVDQRRGCVDVQDQHQHVAPASSGKNYSPHAVLEEDPLFEGVAEAGDHVGNMPENFGLELPVWIRRHDDVGHVDG